MINLCSECNSRFEKDFPEGPCSICENKLDNLQKLLKQAETCMKEEWKTFSISTTIPKKMFAKEEPAWDYSNGESLKSSLNAFFSKALEKSTGKKYSPLFSDGRISINIDTQEVSGKNEPIFLFGRYNKLVTGICQSKWTCLKCNGTGCKHCDGKGKMYEDSVEELIGEPTISKTGGEYTFHASGREDIDVLTFAGRPFILQIKNPDSILLALPALEKEINSPKKIEIKNLKRVPPSSVKLISDSHFPKTYRAWVASTSPLTKEDLSKLDSFDQVLDQRTPERVAHRRADKIRKRRARVLKAKLEEGKIIVDIHADPGTYIKELIHGDRGRTVPSFSSVLEKNCTCERLDVIGIDDEFLKLVLA